MAAPAFDLRTLLDELVSKLEGRIRVTKVILFGSYANHKAQPWSDIDVAIISPDFTSLPLWRRQEVLAEALPGIDVRLSPLGYAPSELADPTPFLGEIIRTGKVVYEAP